MHFSEFWHEIGSYRCSKLTKPDFSKKKFIGPKWAKMGHFRAQNRHISNLLKNNTIFFFSFFHVIRQLQILKSVVGVLYVKILVCPKRAKMGHFWAQNLAQTLEIANHLLKVVPFPMISDLDNLKLLFKVLAFLGSFWTC